MIELSGVRFYSCRAERSSKGGDKIMTTGKIAVTALVIVACFAVGSADAKEQLMKFRLVTTPVSSTFDQVPNAEGHQMGVGNYVGVAVFEDGRLAFKDFVLTMDRVGNKGTYSGYSTYTFQDGDGLNLKFTGEYFPNGNGGDYEVLSGTGAFEGASGTGRFDASKDPRNNALYWDGSFKLELAGK
jgi:hypothetical protein